MVKKIGEVKLNYAFYDDNMSYSDGDREEEELLEISIEKSWEKALKNGDKWHVLYHYSPIRQNILEWYPFDSNATLLEIGSGCGALSGMFCKKVKRVVCAELSERRSLVNANRNRDCSNMEIYLGNFEKMNFQEKFDYITLIGVLEYSAFYMSGSDPFCSLLERVKNFLKDDGVLFIAIENKMGMKYLNGAKEDHTGEFYSGIEDYIYKTVRTFSKPELKKLLSRSGFSEVEFYYPYPDYKMPETVYSDRVLPREGELRLWGTNYDQTRLAMYNEGIMADQVCKDEMSGYFSNSFLVTVGKTKEVPDFVHYTNTRRAEYQTRTTINTRDEVVEKTYLNEAPRVYDVFETMHHFRNELDLEYTNVIYLENNVQSGCLKYAYIDGYPLEKELYILRHNPEQLISRFNELWDYYYCTEKDYETDFIVTDRYKEIFGDAGSRIQSRSLKYTNPDMLLHNLIVCREKVYCIDYEWVFDFPIPKLFLLYRVARDFYYKYMMYFSKYFSLEEFAEKVRVPKEDIPEYARMYTAFGKWVYGSDNYLESYRKPKGTLQIRGL